jgi:hypothetical protein
VGYAIYGGAQLLFILTAIYLATMTGRVSGVGAGIGTFLFGPFGLAYVFWRCFNPLAGLVALVVAFGILFGAVYVTMPKTPDMSRIEHKIAIQIRHSEATHRVQVRCPDSVTWDPGSTFKCTASAGKKLVRVTVRMEENFQYEWSKSGGTPMRQHARSAA